MRDHLDRFGDATVAGVCFATVDEAAAHHRHLGLTFPLLADPERTIYHRFDLGRGSLRAVYSPGTIATYARLLRRGRRMRRPTQDTRQLGGDVVLDAAGVLRAAFRSASPDDRPDIDDLVTAVRSIA